VQETFQAIDDCFHGVLRPHPTADMHEKQVIQHGHAVLRQHARTCVTQAEVPDPVALKVTGQLPAWLCGVLVRNGPGTFDIPIKDGKLKGTTYTFKHMCAAAHVLPRPKKIRFACISDVMEAMTGRWVSLCRL